MINFAASEGVSEEAIKNQSLQPKTLSFKQVIVYFNIKMMIWILFS